MSKADKAKRQAGIARTTKPRNKDKEQKGKQEPEVRVEEAGGDTEVPVELGVKKALRRELKAQMNKGGAKTLAAALLKKTAEGNKTSAEILMTLVMNKTDEDGKAKKKKKRSGPSLAELLASEPEWVDPEPDPVDELEMGRREPENTDF